MSERDLKLYVEDILESIKAIEDFIGDMSFEEFVEDRKTYSATIREYIVIGEAVTALMDILYKKYPDFEWRMIKDFRNLITHEYFGVDHKIVWDVTKLELDELQLKIKQLKKELGNE